MGNSSKGPSSNDPLAQHLRGGKTEGDLKPADFKILAEQEDIKNKIHEDFKRRQLRYNKREEEYRRHIEELQRELRIRLGYEVDAHLKNEKVIEALRDELHSNIEGIQDKIKSLREEQEHDIVRKFKTDLDKLK
jgi:ABC-type phosphate transport system auxiliary subunit